MQVLLRGRSRVLTFGHPDPNSPRLLWLVRRTWVAALILLAGLAGCGGSGFTGYIPPGGGKPPVPNLTGITPDAVIAGGSGFMLTVSGGYLTSSMTVDWNGSALPTTYDSSTSQLQAQVPASDIASVGTVAITVSTVTGQENLTVVPNTGFTLSSVPVEANDIAADPVSGQIYLSMQSGSPTNPDTITELNPSTGQLGASVAVGAEADHLAVSEDGSFLYAGVDQSALVQRFTLPGLSKDIAISLGSWYANDIEVAPGAAHTIAVQRGMLGISPQDQGGVAVYDDGVQRAATVPGQESSPYAEIDSLQWGADTSVLYGEDDGSTSDLYVMTVDSGGVKLANDYSQAFATSLGESPFVLHAKLHYAATTGYLYSDDGQVVNPGTGAAVGSLGSSGVMVLDTTLGYAYSLGQTSAQQGGPDYTLTAYNLTTFAKAGSIVLPSVAGNPVRLIRWGSDGLAFLTNDNDAYPPTPIPGMGVYLISGTFVTSPSPQD